MATAEAKAINSILKTADKTALFGPSVDDLFTSYGDVWEHIKEYHSKYNVIPPFDLIQERFPDLEDVDVKGNSDYYVDTLKAEYMNNRIESLLIKAGDTLTPETAPLVKEKLQEALAKLDRFSATGRDLPIMDFDNAERRYAEVAARAEAMGGTPGIPFGIDFVDACMVMGMQPGDVVSIIGYPARGKSALGALVAAKAMTRRFKPLIFSREMPAEAVQDRIFTILGSGLFSNTDLMRGDLNVDDFREFREKFEGGVGWIHDGTGQGDMTPNGIRAVIDQQHPDFVILDYFQLFMDNRRTAEMTPRMMNLSQEIKSLANQTQIPFLVISSATPPDGGKVDGPPNVERTAWSRQLAYDSTVSMAIHRHDDTDLYQLEGAKNRYGPLPFGFLEWDMDRGIITEKFDTE